MTEIADAFAAALRLIVGLDAELAQIIGLSIRVSLTAVVLAAIVALPAGAALAVFRFPGRRVVVVLLNALMGLPPVVVGLAVYLLLSRSGPVGFLGWLFTPAAMVTAQTILIAPLIAAVARQSMAELWAEYADELRSLGVGPARTIATLLWDGRFGLLTAILAGFGRASAEVGAVIMVGGNIAHVTRTMTTAIALETAKGELALALGLGIVLLAISIGVNAAAYLVGEATRAGEASPA
ncbi:MAG: ABC transporter permease [Alphaproteobacteria bacterium]|nr:ABC transporter permease [Alphaproteobacteria bacterium]